MSPESLIVLILTWGAGIKTLKAGLEPCPRPVICPPAITATPPLVAALDSEDDLPDGMDERRCEFSQVPLKVMRLDLAAQRRRRDLIVRCVALGRWPPETYRRGPDLTSHLAAEAGNRNPRLLTRSLFE